MGASNRWDSGDDELTHYLRWYRIMSSAALEIQFSCLLLPFNSVIISVHIRAVLIHSIFAYTPDEHL